jgi:hypothetical protein
MREKTTEEVAYMATRTLEETARLRAEALRAEGARSLKVLETAEKGSHLYEVHARRVVELAPLVAMHDVIGSRR